MNTGLELQETNDPKVLRKMIFADKQTQSKPSNIRYKSGKENNDPSQMPPKKPMHRRAGSHHRQQSIYFPPESPLETIIQSLKPPDIPSHNRNLSDTDSVVYLGPGDKDVSKCENVPKKVELRLSVVETATGSLLSTEKPIVSPKKKMLPTLGNNETTSYCRYCKKDVHTRVEFNSCYSNRILKAVSSIIGCCSYPSWMASYIVHKCPTCSLVLGKSR